MTSEQGPDTLLRDIGELAGRTADLRHAAAMPDADPAVLLAAVLVELELAVGTLETIGADQSTAKGKSAAADGERRLLRTVFSDAPVPLFLLERDGTVRRVNRQAGALLGASAGYLAGKPFQVFCDLATRAAVRSHLAGVFHSGQRRRTRVRFLSKHGPVYADVTFARVQVNGEPDPLVIAATAPAVDEPPEEREETGSEDGVAALIHRMDLLATATGLLLDDEAFNETVAIRRCARLLATDLADWVVIDLEQNEKLLRNVVIGPAEENCVEVARTLTEVHPSGGSLPATVHGTGQAALHAHVDDLELLGTDPAGLPVCGLVGAASLMCVPLDDGERVLGTLTLTVGGDQGPFDLMDLGVVERVARNLALVIRAGRRYRHRTEVAARLQASLLPRELPEIAGVELAGRYIGATRGNDIGGDFYDVFTTADGWGLVLGDVCGKGDDAAVVTATARHGIRMLARWNPKVGEVLTMVNEALTDQERFVTAALACVRPTPDGVSMMLGSAGHPPAILIRRDGKIRTMSGGGMPLGLFDDDFEVGEEAIDLGPGDTLFLHSDGVLDACDLMRDRFGPERLIEILAAHVDRPVGEMIRAVERELLSFCQNDLRDDVSMLTMRVTES